ncbi:MAG: response regulator [Candidatus Omnitrophica bacterium]|nr:response regulator [Candidatus Omnitrophota bacterium]MCK5259860.1 response regulator [Candidatus Omnitrophota bacterium]
MPQKILIVDDDKGIVEVIKTALTKKGYEVFTAGDGNEGIEMVKKSSPDLILLDVVMPAMNGYEFLRALKAFNAIEGGAMIPVVVITAKEGMEELFKFEGVKEYFVKPAESSELIKKIEEYLSSNG